MTREYNPFPGATTRPPERRHDPVKEMKKAIETAQYIEKDGVDVTLRFKGGTFISFTPMPERFLRDVERQMEWLRKAP